MTDWERAEMARARHDAEPHHRPTPADIDGCGWVPGGGDGMGDWTDLKEKS
jgi:hypothetical protein